MPETVVDKGSPDLPSRKDVGWSDYVLSHLTEEEKFNGNPTVDGLWRLAEIFVGEVVGFEPSVIQAPNSQNGGCATVVYRGAFMRDNGAVYSYSSAADANPENTLEEFARHATAMAETRAAGRMLRRALGLRKVVTAEEMAAPAIERKDDTGNPLFMQHSQFVMLDTLGSKLNIDVKAYIDKYTETYHKAKYDTVGQVPYTIGQELVQHMQKYVQGANKDNIKQVQEYVKGYKPEFKELWNV